MKEICNFFRQQDRFAQHAGIELIDAKPGWAKAKMVIQPCHLNGAGTVHGGAIFTLADFAFAVASNSHGQLAMGVHTSTSFINAAMAGTLYAEAEELSLNRRLGSYQVRISDDQQQLIALFQGTAYRKQTPLMTEPQVDS